MGQNITICFLLFNSTPTADDLESPFFLIHGRDPLKGHTRLFGSGNIRYMGHYKGLILFAELCKLWLSHTKSVQENRLLKTEALEQNKNFKSHDIKVGQIITVKNHLRNTFDTRFISEYRLLKIINECTLLIESPYGKTRKSILMMQSQFQPLQQQTMHCKNLDNQC